MENTKIPIEILSNRFRKYQKHISREMTALQEKINELQTYIDGSNTSSVVSSDEVVSELRKLEERIEALLDQVSTQDLTEKEALRQLNLRLQERNTYSGIADITANNISLERHAVLLIADMLLRKGLLDAAAALAAEHSPSLQDYIDTDIYRQANAVEASLKNGDVSAALTWCADHGSKLRRLGSALEFFLRQEQLVYQNRTLEALQLAQTKLAPLVVETNTEESAESSAPPTATTPPMATPPPAQQRPRSVSLGSSSSTSRQASRSPFSLPFSFSANPLSFFHYISPATPASAPATPETAPPMQDLYTTDQGKYKKEAMCHLMSMLAFTEDGARSYGSMVPHLYEEKYSEHRRKCLVDLFKIEFRRVYGVPKVCPLERLLQLGLFAMKTPVCKSNVSKSHRVTFDTTSPSGTPNTNRSQRRSGQRLSYILSGGDETPPLNTTSVSGSAMLNAFRRLQGSSSSLSPTTLSRGIEHSSSTGSNRGEDRVLISTGAELMSNGRSNSSVCSSASSDMCDISPTTSTPAVTECPVCSPPGQIISSCIPAAVRGSSVLKCRASGLLMTQDNPPLACPNGQVYCKQYVISNIHIVKRSGGGTEDEIACFTCPVSKQVFEMKKLRQVYIA